MTTSRSALLGGSALLATFALVGCSVDSTGTRAGFEADAVMYAADYPSYDSVDAIVKGSDIIVRGTVVSSEVRKLHPEVSMDTDPVANPQAGVPPEEAVESDPVVVTISTVKVSQTLSGDVRAGDTIKVSQLGGELDGVMYEEEHTTRLSEGDAQYVLMLADHGDGNPYDLLNPEQALYTVGPDQQVTPLADGGFNDIGTVEDLKAEAQAVAEPR